MNEEFEYNYQSNDYIIEKPKRRLSDVCFESLTDEQKSENLI